MTTTQHTNPTAALRVGDAVTVRTGRDAGARGTIVAFVTHLADPEALVSTTDGRLRVRPTSLRRDRGAGGVAW